MKRLITYALTSMMVCSFAYASTEKKTVEIQPRNLNEDIMLIDEDEQGQAQLPTVYDGVRINRVCSGSDEGGRFCAITGGILTSLGKRGITDLPIDEADILRTYTDRGDMGDSIGVLGSGIDKDGFIDEYLIASYMGLKSNENNICINSIRRTKSSDIGGIKTAVQSSGGAIIAYAYDKDAVINNSCYSNQPKDKMNREAVIVGWDDNFSGFKNAPSQIGAWIVMDDMFDGGYGYISYYDQSIREYALALDCSIGSYDKVHQYDGGYSVEKDVHFGYTGYMANGYVSDRNQYLDSVGFFVNSNENLEYEVRIYTNPTDRKNPTSGFWNNNSKKNQEIKGSIKGAGYYSMDLIEPIVLTNKDTFFVVVKLQSKDGNVYLPIDTDSKINDATGKELLECKVKSIETQSYISMDGISWDDISRVGNANARIKAFTKEIHHPSGNGKLIAATIITLTLVGGYFVYKIKSKKS